MLFGRLLVTRLRKALLPQFQRHWTRDFDTSLKDVRAALAAIRTELSTLQDLRRRVALLDWIERRRPLLEHLGTLSAESLRPHVLRAIADAQVVADPTTHVIVENVLPADFYQLLVEAIPPAEIFSTRDPVKQDFEMADLPTAGLLTQRVWRFFDDEVIAGIVAPALLERFRSAVVDHYAETGGQEFGVRAAALPHRTVSGRLQLRKPGYHLAPHLDPKRVAVTGLLYFPRPGDTEDFGTQLFSVDRPFVASGLKTFFPEAAGMKCELARTVPYRPNTMMAFVTSRAAHGATLPAGAPLAERYAFQFYVKPHDGELIKLLRDLPAEAQETWAGIR